MARAAPQFVGSQRLLTVAEVDCFVRRAAKGERFVYCEALSLPAGPTAAHVRELARRGIVLTLQERRAGGGTNYLIQRTGFVLSGGNNSAGSGRVGVRPDPGGRNADPALDIIRRRITRAANFGLKCPSDAELAVEVRAELNLDIFTRDQAQARIRKLVDKGIIHSTVATEGGVPTRVVTVLASGKRTALPPKWAALERARRAGAK